jgi:transposase-like protein
VAGVLLRGMARETRETWVKRVERWRDSGLTLKEFAAEIGVNANTLAGWRWRLRSDGRREPGETPTPVSFVELVPSPHGSDDVAVATPVAAMHPAAEPFELILGGGTRIRVPVQFDGRALRRLVDALEAR